MRGDVSRVLLAEIAQQVTQCLVLHRAVGHELIFVTGVVFGERAARDALLEQGLPVAVGVHPGQEVFTQHRVIQATVFFHGQIRVRRAKRLGINATAAQFGRATAVLVHLDPLKPARWRLLHKDVATNVGMRRGHFDAVIV